MSSLPQNPLSVCAAPDAAWVRVTGRANFTTSVDLKKLLQHLQSTGRQRIIIDLSECQLMDSTFLGVLASEMKKRLADPPPPTQLVLVNPNERIRDLIDNLGVTELMAFTECPAPDQPFDGVAPSGADREEITRTCLEAHQTLMEVNPANVPKFKDVARFFEEDLQKQQGLTTG